MKFSALDGQSLWTLQDCGEYEVSQTAIEIGRHLRQTGSEWLVSFEDDETKNGDPITLVVPQSIEPHLTHYLETIRPGFGRIATVSSRLWLAAHNCPLAENSLYQRVVALSKRLFGAPISPQQFRVIAATFLSESSAADALRARPLLGHRSGDTTAAHYIRASSIEASRKVAEAINVIGAASKPGSDMPVAMARKRGSVAKPVRKVD